jgi:hypothetical protein
MPTYSCAKGCKKRDGVTPRNHDSRWECPFEPTYDPVRIQNSRPQKIPKAPTPPGFRPTTSGPAPGGAGPAPVGSSPGPALYPTPARGPVIRTAPFELAARGAFAEVQSRDPLNPSPAQVKPDWILDPPYSKRAWQLLYGGAEYGANKWGEYWENPKKIDHAIFDFSQGQLVNFESPDSYMCRIPTWALKQLGCTTVEEARTMIDDAEFIAFVGRPFLGVGEYMYSSYVDSPKLKRAREEAERKQREAATLMAARTGTPLVTVTTSPGAVP